MKNNVRSRKRERGATLILITFIATFVLVPVTGLAIDGSMLFWMKARLSAAVDAAALAAGRSLNVGPDESSQEANATVIANQYFSANFPTGLMRSTVTGGAPTIVYTTPSTHIRTVQVTAYVVVPLFFMPLLRVNTGTVGATGTASRRDANIILVLDRSTSMNNSSGSCTALVSSAQNFVSRFANGRDRLGLVTFSSTAHVDFAPSLTFSTGSPTLTSVLSTLYCAGFTSTAEGLNLGYYQITNVIAQPGALNVILLFTDGQPSSLTAMFPVKTAADNRYGSTSSNYGTTIPVSASTCVSSAAIKGLLTDTYIDTAAAQLAATGYTLGLYQVIGMAINSTAVWPSLLTTSGCHFASDQTAVRQDIAYIPETDFNGNSTAGGVPGVPLPDRFTSGPYSGFIRPDVPRTLRYVAFSAADSQAQTIHNDTVYAPVIYTIGLAGNEQIAMNEQFMERMANDPRANNYDATKPQGQFILASDNASLAAAFNQIASQVLRLSQ